MSEEHITNDIGRVVPLHRGEYVNETQYEINDIVSYLGSTYWKFTGPKESGVLPTDTTKWRIVTNVTDAEEYVEQAKQARNEAVTAKTGAEAARDAASISATNAATSATNAGASATTATEKATIATTKASEAGASADAAEDAKDDAITAKNDAINAKVDAITAKTGAENAKESAATFAQSAETSATNAATSATAAGTSATQAGTAKDAAVAAKTGAETAQTGAVNAKNDAVAAKTAAEAAQTAAETAQDLAEDAAEEAEQIVGDKIDMEAVAPVYDNTKAYKIGNLLTYLGKQYEVTGDDGVEPPVGTLPTDTDYFTERPVSEIIEMIKQGAIVTGHSAVADNLTPYSEDSGTTQEEPFISQGTGTDNNSVIVTTGNIARQLEKQGNTVGIGQKVKNPQFTNGTLTDWTASNVVNGGVVNGYVKLTPNNPSSPLQFSQGTSVISGHKYLYIYDVYCVHGNQNELIFPTDDNGNVVALQQQLPTTRGQITAFVYTPSASQTFITQRLYAFGSGYEIYVKSITRFDITSWDSDIITDLTSHPEHFSWYYNGSLAYDAGSLKNCNGRYLECGQGRNLFAGNSTSSGQYIGHYYINSSFEKNENNSYNCYRVMVVPNTQYFIGRDDNNWLSTAGVKRFVDNDLNFISGDKTGESAKYGIFTTPANCRYIEFCTSTNTNYNIDLELYYTPEQGGEGYLNSSGAAIHYPYVPPIRIDTGNETLKAFDKKLPSGVITRGTLEKDLGSLTWIASGSGGVFYCANSLFGTKGGICSKYIVSTDATEWTISAIGDKTIEISGNNYLVVADSAFAGQTAEQFKTAMSGVMLQTHANTSTEEQGTPFSEYADINDYSYMAWFDTDGNLVSIPQGCKLFYPVDYKGFLDDGVMYTDGDFTSLAKNEDITDSALNARGYYKMQDLLTTFGANGMVGGTLRQTLANAKSLDFDNTKCIDLGDITWNYTTTPVPYFYATINDIKYVADLGDVAKILSTIYKTVSWNTAYNSDKVICLTTTNIRIKDSSYTDTTTFKNAMKGKLVAYEKAST